MEHFWVILFQLMKYGINTLQVVFIFLFCVYLYSRTLTLLVLIFLHFCFWDLCVLFCIIMYYCTVGAITALLELET